MNSYLPDLDEASSSQIPALLELVNLGYTYIPRAKVAELREGASQYILRGIAFDALRRINSTDISDKSIRDALFDAEKLIDMGAGVFKASEEIFSLLLAGRSVPELINGRRTSPQMQFIDWRMPANNAFHVCAEFEISEGATSMSPVHRRPDIVAFVNGIPFAVIENKKASVKLAEAVAQMVRNQGRNETPKFFIFPQILIATNMRELKFGTMLTPSRFYSHWKEKDVEPAAFDAEVAAVINRPVGSDILRQITTDLLRYLGRNYKLLIRKTAEQERVSLQMGTLTVFSLYPHDRPRTRQLLDAWYAEKARQHFAERLKLCAAQFAQKDPPRLGIRRLAKRWGSYSRKTHRIWLNLELIKASRTQIDYVLTHEFCHITRTAHDKAFYRLLSSHLPDWQEVKAELERSLLSQ